MARESIDLPLKITLTTAGVEWFERNHKMLKRLQMADDRLAYGIAVATISGVSLQKMINIDYIASVELARSEFSTKSRQIIDLTKLIVHRILLKRFENETFRLLVGSALVNRWNRQNPRWSIGKDINSNQSHVDSLLAGAGSEMHAVSLEIQAPLLRKYVSSKVLSEDDRRLRAHLSNSFAVRASKPLWCVLAKSRGQPEYEALGKELQGLLEAYVEKAVISKYLALIVVELLDFTEVSHVEQVASLLRGRRARLADRPTREEVRRHMEAEGDLFSLTYHLESEGASIDMAQALRVTIQEQGDQEVKERLEALIGTDAKEPSLLGFSGKSARPQIEAESVYHNLRSLREQCEKQKVGVAISISRIPRRNLSLINLAFQL